MRPFVYAPLAKAACTAMAITPAPSPALSLVRSVRGGGAGVGLGVVSGLLASNCCVLQLALNILGYGCAGFRRLERYRPYFLAVHLAAIVLLWARKGSGGAAAACGCAGPAATRAVVGRIATSVLLLCLAFSEYGVGFVNDRGGIRVLLQSALGAARRGKRAPPSVAFTRARMPPEVSPAGKVAAKAGTGISHDAIPTSGTNAAVCAAAANGDSAAAGAAAAEPALGEKEVRLWVSGMKCEGCRHGVVSALGELPWVESVQVQLADAKGKQRPSWAAAAGSAAAPGTAAVILKSGAPEGAWVKLVEVVAKAGYRASLVESSEVAGSA